jgi:hypothetical protein
VAQSSNPQCAPRNFNSGYVGSGSNSGCPEHLGSESASPLPHRRGAMIRIF